MGRYAGCTPVDIIIGKEFQGDYMAKQLGVINYSYRKPSITLKDALAKFLQYSTDLPIAKASIVWN